MTFQIMTEANFALLDLIEPGAAPFLRGVRVRTFLARRTRRCGETQIMMAPDSHVDAIVIGAGVSGLIAARMAQANGARVLVLDKGRGCGRRLATRRTASGVGRAKKEESEAPAQFGDEYRRYQATSGMFWPRIRM